MCVIDRRGWIICLCEKEGKGGGRRASGGGQIFCCVETSQWWKIGDKRREKNRGLA